MDDEPRYAQMSAEERAVALADLVATLNLYIGRFVETQLTTAQRELLYDVVQAEAEAAVDHSDEPLPRWWRDDAPV
ncbi:hypothetical protein [Miltoncostaea oceani]|uniref:hypothetical protein n=1 Tax=Miltoncostaea oceani TaxID=2843216 RepID=UPI001C3D4BF6|nr:hypothetical protein [Miltoncostaea oceani]